MLMDWAGSVGALTMGMGVEAMGVVTGRMPKIRPRVLRRLLLTFEDSVQGQALALFGADRDQRADTLVRLLRGTTEDDLNELITALQEAFVRVNTEEELRAARRDRDRRTQGDQRSGRRQGDRRPRRSERDRRPRHRLRDTRAGTAEPYRRPRRPAARR